MSGAYLFGWNAANKVWVKCLVNEKGELIMGYSDIFENVPTDGEHEKGPDSDWAYDHDAKVDAHHAKYTDVEAEAAINADADHGSTASHNYFSGSHPDLSDVTADQHHTKYTDAEAQSLIDSHAADVDAHHAKYTDAEAEAAINADADHGSTAPHNYFSGSHPDLSDVIADQHHTKYTDAEVQSLIDNHAAKADVHHNKDHAASHKDGGSDELDAAELAGAKGTDGQILTSGGAACSWQDPAGGGVPSGTKMLFKQNSAPSGWTFVSEDNDRVILNTSTESEGGNTGGGWTISGLSVNGHALTEAELPSLSGSFEIRRLYKGISSYLPNSSGKMSINYEGGISTETSSGIDLGDSGYNADVVNIGFGSDNAHSHGLTADGNWRPSYVKVITCQKD